MWHASIAIVTRVVDRPGGTQFELQSIHVDRCHRFCANVKAYFVERELSVGVLMDVLNDFIGFQQSTWTVVASQLEQRDIVDPT
jgi:hypothetical protein